VAEFVTLEGDGHDGELPFGFDVSGGDYRLRKIRDRGHAEIITESDRGVRIMLQGAMAGINSRLVCCHDFEVWSERRASMVPVWLKLEKFVIINACHSIAGKTT